MSAPAVFSDEWLARIGTESLEALAEQRADKVRDCELAFESCDQAGLTAGAAVMAEHWWKHQEALQAFRRELARRSDASPV